jgi:carboxy-cis,cis-muconate cyclase
MSFSVDANGTLTSVADSWSYAAASGVHGLALAPPGHPPAANDTQLVYSADLSDDRIWTHAINLTTGRATSPAASFPMPYAGMHPRHLAAHPSGRYLYAVMEADNSVAQFPLAPASGAVGAETVRHMLIPIDANTTQFWSAEVALSPSGRYLWATARARTNATTGFISAFLLDDDGGIVRKMFRVPTTTLGGWANAINPAPWGEEYAVMTDYPMGYVQVWKMDGARERGGLVEYTGARAIARVDIGDGGCCANAIWYS